MICSQGPYLGLYHGLTIIDKEEWNFTYGGYFNNIVLP
jgi:hypothetical protein